MKICNKDMQWRCAGQWWNRMQQICNKEPSMSNQPPSLSRCPITRCNTDIQYRFAIQICNKDMQYIIWNIVCLYLSGGLFPNSCADRGSNRENSIEACCYEIACRLENGFRESFAAVLPKVIFKNEKEKNTWKNTCFLCSLFCVFCMFAKGFSLKM